MPTYEDADVEKIAAAVSIDLSAITSHAAQFERAALWLRLGYGSFAEERQPPAPVRVHRHGGAKPPPAGGTPPERLRKLKSVSDSARRLVKNVSGEGIRRDRIEASRMRLLKDLGIDDPLTAEDGPGDSDIFDVLTFPDGSSRDSVQDLCRRLAELPQGPELVAAAQELDELALRAAREVVRLGELIVPKEQSGDWLLSLWVADMMVLYTEVIGREPGTSVGHVGYPNEGIGGGPLVRFVITAARPLGFRDEHGMPLSEDAVRSRTRRLLEAAAV